MVHLISKSNASQNVRIAKNGTLVVAIIQSDFHITQMVAKNSAAVKRNLGRNRYPRTVIRGPRLAGFIEPGHFDRSNPENEPSVISGF